MKPFELEGVLAREANQMPWTALKDTPGFGGVDIAGVSCKYFGEGDQGPWAYLVKHAPGTRVERHTHHGNVIHYLIEGDWLIGGQRKGPGWFHYEQKGLRYGPIVSGDAGSVFLAIYDNAPDFVRA